MLFHLPHLYTRSTESKKLYFVNNLLFNITFKFNTSVYLIIDILISDILTLYFMYPYIYVIKVYNIQ